jgi:lipopolysaccharide transport system ATP-binding protein
MTVLQVTHLGKAYRKYGSELKRIASWFGLPVKPAEEHWVLHDINFSIQAGEAIGILGQNGAGKSTLLKMIAGTLLPTRGGVQVTSRIAAILELGMGFNPEFSGRQNAQHGLAMMGFSPNSKPLPKSENTLTNRSEPTPAVCKCGLPLPLPPPLDLKF